jgi:hypothetical protein
LSLPELKKTAFLKHHFFSAVLEMYFTALVRRPIFMHLKCLCFKIIFYVDSQTIRIVTDVMSVQLQAQFDHCSHALAQYHHIESKQEAQQLPPQSLVQ